MLNAPRGAHDLALLFRRSRPDPPGGNTECLHCGYDLRGCPTRRCPECGKIQPPAIPKHPPAPLRWYHIRSWIVCAPVAVPFGIVLLLGGEPLRLMSGNWSYAVGGALMVGALINVPYALLASLLAPSRREEFIAGVAIAVTVAELLMSISLVMIV